MSENCSSQGDILSGLLSSKMWRRESFKTDHNIRRPGGGGGGVPLKFEERLGQKKREWLLMSKVFYYLIAPYLKRLGGDIRNNTGERGGGGGGGGEALPFRLHATRILKAERAYFSETLSYLPKGKVSEHSR